MKILLSAFACSPYAGSEPGVGWHWATHLAAMGHQVHILLSHINKKVMQQYTQHYSLPDNLVLHYISTPFFGDQRPTNNMIHRLQYIYWQRLAKPYALKLNQQITFDIVHHLTWSGFRFSSHLWQLGGVFVIGPIGGGESMPWRLYSGLGVRAALFEFTRWSSAQLAKLNPSLRRCYQQADIIFIKNNDNLKILPSSVREKCIDQIEIGVKSDNIRSISSLLTPNKKTTFNIMYVGRFLQWKGMKLGLSAYAQYCKIYPNSCLTMVGGGDELARWQQQVKTLGIAHQVKWVSWMAHEDCLQLYQTMDIFLFPSFHDSGGSVVLEAMSQGLPVVCFDLGGPGVIVDKNSGICIQTKRHSWHHLTQLMSRALVALNKDPVYRQKLALGALQRAQQFTWDKVVKHAYSHII